MSFSEFPYERSVAIIPNVHPGLPFEDESNIAAIRALKWTVCKAFHEIIEREQPLAFWFSGDSAFQILAVETLLRMRDAKEIFCIEAMTGREHLHLTPYWYERFLRLSPHGGVILPHQPKPTTNAALYMSDRCRIKIHYIPHTKRILWGDDQETESFE